MKREKSSVLSTASSSETVTASEPTNSLTSLMERRMSFVADSLAKTLASLVPAQDCEGAKANSGLNTSELFPSSCRPGLSLKTCPHFSIEDSQPFSTVSMKSGMTLSGTLFQLPLLALRTVGKESGSLPTPAARDYKDTPGMAKQSGKRSRIDQLHRRIYFEEKTPPRGGKVNPEFVEWLMGFPRSWTALSA